MRFSTIVCCVDGIQSYAIDWGLRMIRLVPEVSVEEFFALGFGEILAGRLQGHEHGIDLTEDLGIRILEDPAFLSLIVGVEYSKTLNSLRRAFFLSPNTVVVPR